MERTRAFNCTLSDINVPNGNKLYPLRYNVSRWTLERNRWFLFGSRVGDLKLFNLALDRIKSVEPTIVPFKEKSDFNSEHFFDDVIGVSRNIRISATSR